jgi:hypothetical protein
MTTRAAPVKTARRIRFVSVAAVRKTRHSSNEFAGSCS